MPFRVQEGPVDPYEPFPLAEAPQGGWTPAPIVRGRDIGRPGAGAAPASPDAGDAQFVDLDIPRAARVPAETLLTFDEPLEATPHAGDGAQGLDRIAAVGIGGDGEPWAVVDTGAAGRAEPLDPWAIVPEVTDAVYEAEQPETDPTPPPALPADDPYAQFDDPHVATAPDADAGAHYTMRHGGPPLSSTAILIIGTLALLCLVLAAALAFQALGEEDEPPALDAPVAPAVASALPAGNAVRDRATWTSSLPVSDTTLTAIERAAMGPLETELDRLGWALQAAFGQSSAEVAPVLRPYVAHAAERMAVHPSRFRLVVEAPNVDLAITRAEAIMRAFQTAGAPADKLTMTALSGMPAVRFES